MTASQLYRRIYRCALPLYGQRESSSVARRILEDIYGIDRNRYIVDPEAEINADGLDGVLQDLGRGRPVQYITGREYFCGLELKVSEGVLIPRPETGELVKWIADESDGAERILDIGTGSGAIAVALASQFPGAEVWAVDISETALEIARRNSEAHGAEVVFRRCDILDPACRTEIGGESFDIIVSNPPYVPLSEKAAMHSNVRDYEPYEALFVPDSDPLLFYRAIARFSYRSLSPGGRLYFETHKDFARDVASLMESEGLVYTEIRKDINGRERMVRAGRVVGDGCTG